MEIPFIVNARKDTGLFNSKVGIWLFLASEVTLFGGLFSGYLFLRLYADYPWPERALPVLPGLINTFVLIGSSVTVVFAWAALKMREWRKFQIYMAITLVCALLFMVLKGIEYNAKFNHQAVRISGGSPVEDYGILEGHKHPVLMVGDKLVEPGDSEALKHSLNSQAASVVSQLTTDNEGRVILNDLKEARLKAIELQVIAEADRKKLEDAKAANQKVEDLVTASTKSAEEAQKATAAVTELARSVDNTIGAEVVGDTFNSLEKAQIESMGDDFLSKLNSAIQERIEGAIVDEKFYANRLIFRGSDLTFALKRPAHEAYVDLILEQAPEGTAIILTDDYVVDGKMIKAKGTELSIDTLDDLEEAFLDARSHDSKIRTQFEKASWAWIRDEQGVTDLSTYVVESDLWKDRRAADVKAYTPLMLSAAAEVAFKIDPPFNLILDPGDTPPGLRSSEQIRLRDDTVVKGKMLDSPIIMAVDAIDFRHTAQRAEMEDIDPWEAIKTSWILTHKAVHHEGGHENSDDRNELKKAWDCHMAWLKYETERLKEHGDRVPTTNDKYRVNWDQMLAYKKLDYDADKVYEAAKADDGSLYSTHLFDLSGFAGANHSKHHFPHVEIPREKVGFESTFTPKWSTYYAIYFTITGLHGLHVIGGALVLGYYLFFGRKMYDSNPEWLANRVEVGGLFWHFVDLVWIFLFPILYLM